MPTPKIRPRPSLQPPAIAATLDMSQPGERAVHDLLQRFCTGRWPLWRLLGLQRGDGVLFAAVEWLRSQDPARFAVAELSLQHDAVRWRYFPTATAARQALAESGTRRGPGQRAPKFRSAA